MIVQSLQREPKQISLREIVGQVCGQFQVEWTVNDAVVIALAAGMTPASDLPFLYEGYGPRVLPTLASAIAGVWLVPFLNQLGIHPNAAVYGGVALTLNNELPAEGVARVTAQVLGVNSCGANAKVTIQSRVAGCSGDIAHVHSSIFLLECGGDGWCAGDTSDRSYTPVPETPSANRIVLQVGMAAAATYRLIFPLRMGTPFADAAHVDPERSTTAGFARPVVHGQTLLAIAARAVLLAAGTGDHRFLALGGRFKRGVEPGSTLSVNLWPSPGGGWAAEIRDNHDHLVVAGVNALLADPKVASLKMSTQT